MPRMRRRPRLREVGDDPDYRFTLANERTFLAWVRTALALNAGGLAVVELLPPLALNWGREAIGIGLVAMGTLIAMTSYRRWEANERAMREQAPLPVTKIPLVLAVGASAATVLALALLIASDV
jgi:putative membrane protein